jgi:hypothetical protein
VWGILNFLLTEDMPNSTTRHCLANTLLLLKWCVCVCVVCVSSGDKAIAAFLTTHTLFTDSGHVLDLAINLYPSPDLRRSPAASRTAHFF